MRMAAAATIAAFAAGAHQPAHARNTSDRSEQADDAGGSASGRVDASLRLTARAILTEARVGTEEETVDGDALALVAAPALTWSDGGTSIAFRDNLTRIEYLDEARADRWQNVARLSGEVALGRRTTLSLFGERSDNLFTAEFTSADEWEAGGELVHSIDAAHRIALGASWRERRYDDASRSRGRGVRIEGEYRYRFAPNHYAYARLRHERIASAEARREITRWLAEASYLWPIARHLRAGAEIGYQRLDFPGRQLGSGRNRRDDIVTPQLSLTYSPCAWRIAARARYALRQSTDPAFDRSGYRFEVEVSHAF
jgi:hypothetical protein